MEGGREGGTEGERGIEGEGRKEGGREGRRIPSLNHAYEEFFHNHYQYPKSSY